MVHLIKHRLVKMTDFILESPLVDRPQLFQKDHRIPLNAIRRRIDLYMFIFDVIAAQITVGLCRLPTSF